MKILIATDFSSTASNAVEFGVNLAKEKNAEIILLTTHLPPSLADDPSSRASELIIKEDQAAAQRKLDALTKAIRQQYYSGTDAPIQCTTYNKLADPVYEINRVALQENVDVVIIGNVGEPDPNRFYGHTAIEITRKPTVPILIVPDKSSFSRFKSVLWGYEVQPNGIEHISKLVASFCGRLHLAHVGIDSVSTLQIPVSFQNELLRTGFSEVLTHEVSNPDIIAGLDSIVQAEKIDLLILTKHSRNFLEGIFHRSVTKREIFKGEIPILVIGETD